jgi:hypothetical protein
MFTRTPLRVEALEDRTTPSTLTFNWLDPAHLNVTLVNDGTPLSSATYGSISQVLTGGQQVVVNLFVRAGSSATQVGSGVASLTSAQGFANALGTMMNNCFIGPGLVDPDGGTTPATTSASWASWLSGGLQSLLSAINSYGQPSQPLSTAGSGATSGGG